MLKKLLLGVTFQALVLIGTFASAAPITYTFSGTASGTAGTTNFTNAAFTITVLGDTTGIIEPSTGLFQNPDLSSTIQIAGVGTGTFTTDKAIFDNQSVPALGFSNANGNILLLDLLDINGGAFATYSLDTSIGPIFDATPFAVNQFSNIPSTLGNITLTTASDVTFNAVTRAAVVPEPTSIALWTLGAIGLAAVRRRRQQLAA